MSTFLKLISHLEIALLHVYSTIFSLIQFLRVKSFRKLGPLALLGFKLIIVSPKITPPPLCKAWADLENSFLLLMNALFAGTLYDFPSLWMACVLAASMSVRMTCLSLLLIKSMVLPLSLMTRLTSKYAFVNQFLSNMSDNPILWYFVSPLIPSYWIGLPNYSISMFKNTTANFYYIYTYSPNYTIHFTEKHSLNFYYIIYCSLKDLSTSLPPTFLVSWVLAMDKGKGKVSFANMVITDTTKKNLLQINSDYQTTKGSPITHGLPAKPPLGGVNQVPKENLNNKSQTSKFDPKALALKLASARNQAKKRKELTLVSFLVGGQSEFPKLFTKLRTEWRASKGAISFYVLKAGWFEVNFTNQVDFNKIWASRPYHIFSQLLLLKQWYPGFDPAKESISTLDLWVRLHFLPEELANAEAISAIIEGNFAGHFIKMDPSHNSNRMNMFTRFCINSDVSINVGKKIIIPDVEGSLSIFKLWFDDFPDGCGACGFPDHVFEDCPRRFIPIPTLQITIKKNASLRNSIPGPKASLDNSHAWSTMGKNNKPLPNEFTPLKHKNKPYLAENSGVEFLYESEESDEVLNGNLEQEQENPDMAKSIPASVDISMENSPGCQAHPHFPLGPDSLMNPLMDNKEKDQMPLNSEISKALKNDHAEHSKLNHPTLCTVDCAGLNHDNSQDILVANDDYEGAMNHNYIFNTDLPAELNLSHYVLDELLSNNNNFASYNPPDEVPIPEVIVNEAAIFDDQDNMFEDDGHQSLMDQDDEDYFEEDEEPFEDDDAPLHEEIDEPTQDVQNNSPSNPTASESNNSLILICNDPPFTEEDIDDFLSFDPNEAKGNTAISDTSYHSTHNSIPSSSSMVQRIEDLGMNYMELSTTHSSKRKNSDSIDDTASSSGVGGKKPKL